MARNGAADDLLPAIPSSAFALKSPECRADRGRSISKPAAAKSRRVSGEAMIRGVCSRFVDAGVFDFRWFREFGRDVWPQLSERPS